MKNISENIQALIFLIAFVFIWSFSVLLMFVGIRLLPATVLVAARAIIAAVFMLIFFGKFSELKLNKLNMIYIGAAGILGIAIAPLFQVIKQFSYAPSASDIVFILCLAPIFMSIGSFIFLEKPTFEKIIGMSIALLGIVCVLANWEHPSSFAPFSKFLRSEVWVLGSALAWAGFTIFSKKLVEEYEPTVAATLVVATGTIPLIFWATVNGSMPEILKLYSSNWILVVLLGVFATGLGSVFWFKALDKVEVSKAGSIMFFAPVLITLPTIFERKIGLWGITPMMTTPVIVGSILVIIGIIVIWKEPKKSENRNLEEN